MIENPYNPSKPYRQVTPGKIASHTRIEIHLSETSRMRVETRHSETSHKKGEIYSDTTSQKTLGNPLNLRKPS